jgi:hypothetical protein
MQMQPEKPVTSSFCSVLPAQLVENASTSQQSAVNVEAKTDAAARSAGRR